MDFNTSLTWTTPILLGAFHGLNPAMGWLFAVAQGLQERRLKAVVLAMGPIGLGHALAILAVAVPFWLLQIVISQQLVIILAGVSLIAFAIYKIATRFRHVRWVGMRITPLQLVLWSTLMAAAHGAGLMLIPALARLTPGSQPAAQAAAIGSGHHDHHAHLGDAATSIGPALLAIWLHMAAMLVVMGLLAMIVYKWIGVEILRKAWINLDLVWTAALLVVGGVTVTLAVFPVL